METLPRPGDKLDWDLESLVTEGALVSLLVEPTDARELGRSEESSCTVSMSRLWDWCDADSLLLLALRPGEAVGVST